MKISIFAIAAIACWTAGTARAQFGPPPSGPCDRACLMGFVDDYLSALVAHTPQRLKTTEGVRFTENDVELPLGEALWRTANGLGTYRLYFADAEAGQVGFFGTIRENGEPAAIALRLKVEERKISEVEQLVVRDRQTAENLEKLGAPDPIFDKVIPEADRLSREELFAITDKYFEAIEAGSGDVAPFDPECARFENGRLTSGDLGCGPQLDTKRFDYIQRIDQRRFYVADPERGLTFGFFMFNHPGDLLSVTLPSGEVYAFPPAARRPMSVDVAELFKIRDGKIRKIEALMTSMAYGSKSPFYPPAEGNPADAPPKESATTRRE